MSKIKLEIAVDATPEKVWEVLGDFGNVYKWSPAVISSASKSGHERGSDAIGRCEGPGFGTVAETVTDWTEGEGFTFEVEATGPVKKGISEWRIRTEGGDTFVSVAFDFPTLMGYDSDDPLSEGEVGKCGVAIASLADMPTLVPRTRRISGSPARTSCTCRPTQMPIALSRMASSSGTFKSAIKATESGESS